jgi:hypothetical protein
MLATLYNVAVDLPLQESAWWAAFLWFCRCLYLFSYIRCYCCGGSVCEDCDDGFAPDEIQVVLSGVAEVSCGDCDANWNRTFVTEFYLPVSTFHTCCWSTELFADQCVIGTPPGATNADHLLVSLPLGGSGEITVIIANKGSGTVSTCFNLNGNNLVTWYSTVHAGSGAPCTTLEDEDIPYLSGGGGANGCDFTGSTCLLTAL